MLSVPRSVTLSADSEQHGHRVRRRKLVDRRLQGILLVGLVALELGMLGGAMLYLYGQFSATIDANLFTVHRTAQTPLLPTFLKQLGGVVVVMGVVNTLALLLANFLWVGYIKRVIGAFRARLERISRLDLTQPVEAGEAQHEVLQLLESWRCREVIRAAQIERLLAQLPHPSDEVAVDEARLRQVVQQLDAILQNIR